MKSSRYVDDSAPNSTSATPIILVLAACVPLAFGVMEAWIEDRWLTLMLTLAALSLICLLWMIIGDESGSEEEAEE